MNEKGLDEEEFKRLKEEGALMGDWILCSWHDGVALRKRWFRAEDLVKVEEVEN